MEPVLLPGDRVYVEPPSGPPPLYRRGEIVVAVDPELPARWIIKRIHAVAGEATEPGGSPVPPDRLYLLGDNPAQSRDSRAFGPVPVDSVIGTVRRRYWPMARRGAISEA